MFQPHAFSAWNHPFAYLQMLRVMRSFLFDPFFPRRHLIAGHGGHGMQTEGEHLARRYYHPWHHADSDCAGIEGDAARACSMWTSPWAKNPQSKVAEWQDINRWCSGISDNSWSRLIACYGNKRGGSDRSVHKKRNGSCYEQGDPATESPAAGEHSWCNDGGFRRCFPRLPQKLSGSTSLSLWYVLKTVPLQGAAL